MYIGHNPTALRSQKWFANSLIELMKETDYSKITIKEICIKSDLSRQTFYQLFSAKEEVLRYCLRTWFYQVEKETNDISDFNFKQLTYCYLSFFSQHKEFVQLLIKHNLEYLLEDELFQIIQQLAEKVTPSYPEYIRTYANAFISGAISNTMLCWFKSEDKISENELSTLICRISQGEFYPEQNL